MNQIKSINNRMFNSRPASGLYSFPASASYLKHGVTPNTLHQIIANIHDLSMYRDCLVEYFLNYWSAKYILKDSEGGCIFKNQTMYHIVYLNPVTRGKILAAVQAGNSLQQYKLSFRKALPEFNLPAYVLISEVHDSKLFLEDRKENKPNV